MTSTPFTAVFDLDGTLVDTAPDLHAALVHCFAQKDLPAADLATIRDIIGHGARVMIQTSAKATGTELDDELLDQLHREFLDYYVSHIADYSRPFDGILETLSFLKSQDALISVCTNKTQALADEVLNTLGIAELFDSVIGADKASEKKPSPAHVLEAIQQAGGCAEHAVLIGDSSTDGFAANAAGVPFILMTYGYLDDAVYETVRYGQLDNATELPAVLKTLIN